MAKSWWVGTIKGRGRWERRGVEAGEATTATPSWRMVCGLGLSELELESSQKGGVYCKGVGKTMEGIIRDRCMATRGLWQEYRGGISPYQTGLSSNPNGLSAACMWPYKSWGGSVGGAVGRRSPGGVRGSLILLRPTYRQ